MPAAKKPFRKVIDRHRSSVSRTYKGNSVYALRLECGHTQRRTKEDAEYVKRVRCENCEAK